MSARSGKRVLPLLILPAILLILLSLHLHLTLGWSFSSLTQSIKRPPAAGIVVASLRREDTSWVHQHLPGWSRSVYVADDPSAEFTVPKNKGREAMVYLTHIINHYDTLPPSTIFIHAARFAWHNDDPDYDALATLHHLNLDHIQSSGYVNLRCAWVLGCPVEIRPHQDAATDLDSIGTTAADGRKITTKEVFKRAFEELMPGVEVPREVGVGCCSQFAVSREAVRRRSREDYVRWREWLLQTPLGDDLSGRVLEYMWHIIFGKGAIFCPSAAECYCNLYGLCDLECKEDKCSGRYVLPKYAALPKGWPRVGWSGEERNFTGPD
ncbi:hypothetical protein F5144DRAFT_377219 [Chaetomium tenue]|uniref:Uncharacterized protein n=1 Tax=Chaetomium tenue TaxID=1854479 RepID=A0ACB7NUQ1_9PEZI|nr:hypothetical protein F5144DRAFT_377219 [Chaetomium globosum]